jgi:phospho-N-acetylmuramoyl-pentapeptide-transferase
MASISTTLLTDQLTTTLLLSSAAFVLAMLLTPIYTYLAYRFKFWKRQRSTSTTGELLKVFTKLHEEKFKRRIPTMAGIITVLAITIVTVAFNLDRAQTWLPLAALIGGGVY